MFILNLGVYVCGVCFGGVFFFGGEIHRRWKPTTRSYRLFMSGPLDGGVRMLNGPLWLGRERHGCRVDPATLLPPKNRGLPRDLQWSGYGLHKGRGWLMDACFGGT